MPEQSNDAALRVTVLGPLRAWHGAAELKLGPPRQRAVFAILAARAGHPVPVHELVAGVWGSDPPASAANNVHTYISRLRLALPGSEYLSSDPAGYTLNLEHTALDANRFEQARSSARQCAEDDDLAGAASELDRARALWRGDPLSDVPGPFAERERRRLDDLLLDTIEHRAHVLIELGELGDLVAELGQLVRDRPLRESLHWLFMLALHRGGRHAEALEAYHKARKVLAAELDVQPGRDLRSLYQEVLAATAPSAPASGPWLSVVPVPVAKAMRRDRPDERLVGRDDEKHLLRGLLDGVLGGRGKPVWIEGEAGLGKSELLTAALSNSAARGCQVGWAAADELARHFPLQVIVECLGVETTSPDAGKAKLATDLHEEPAQDSWGPSDPILSVVDRLLALVDQTCAAGPLVLVIDDLHWADEASVLLLHRLAAATQQLPLLLVIACRPSQGRRELSQLREGVQAKNGYVLTLEPLTSPQAEQIIERVLGARLGPNLHALVRQVSGNPLYARELAHDLVRRDAIRVVDGVARIDGELSTDLPRSLLAAVNQALATLSPATIEMLRTAALLGAQFAVEDISALTGTAPLDLLPAFDEATTAGVLVASADQFTFRHPVHRHALYKGIPTPERAAAHRQAAETLTAVGAPVKRVAEQLVAAPVEMDRWVVDWLVLHRVAVSSRAPLIAVELFRRALDSPVPDAQQRPHLLAALVKVLFLLDRMPEAEASSALESSTDPAELAEMRQLRAAMLFRCGDVDGAIELLADAVHDDAVPELWRGHHRSLLANFRRGDLTDLDRTERTAHQLLASAAAEGQRYPIAHAWQTLWLVHSIRREHSRALTCVGEALDAAGDGPELAGQRFDLLDNQMFTLQNLDRLDEAEAALRAGYKVAAAHDLPTGLQVSAAVHYYWTGQWDEALAELDSVIEDGPAIAFHGLREPGAAALLLHGVAALIAVHREQPAVVAAHLDAGEAYVPTSSAERESCDFYLAARGMAAEQREQPDEALRILAPILRPSYAEIMLRHQWLPDIARIALGAGAVGTAHDALAICTEEAGKEDIPARAFAAEARCRAWTTGDPEPALAAAEHYRRVGRRVELATTLTDAAELLARAGYTEKAVTALTEAAGILAALPAQGSLRRAEARLRRYGVRRRPLRQPVGFGQDGVALSAVETRIAHLVAAGMSNPEIAAELTLPRRTVQSHVTRVLSKLNADSRSSLGTAVRAGQQS